MRNPESEDARWQPGVRGSGERRDGTDSSTPDPLRKQIVTAQARAALLGVEIHEIEPRAYLLRLAGAELAVVRGADDLQAVVDILEAASATARLAITELRGAA